LFRYAHAVEAVGGADMVAALLPVLAQTLRQDAVRLDAACADAQWVAAAAVLHGLKGVLPLFCVPEMAQRIIECTQQVCQQYDWRCHCITVVWSHVHILLSWRGFRARAESPCSVGTHGDDSSPWSWNFFPLPTASCGAPPRFIASGSRARNSAMRWKSSPPCFRRG
jgi:hypothetical protein